MAESAEKLWEILNIVEQYKESEYQQVIVERKDYEVMYHLSPARSNLISWLPIRSHHTVLEIGAECGAYTGTLAGLASHVTCLEESAQKLEINRARNKNQTNICYLMGGLDALISEVRECYDWIILTGKNAMLVGEVTPYLKDGGRMVLAVDNSLAVKYWAGVKENADSIGKKRLKSMLREAGFAEMEIYYPYPDYQFPMMLYSDSFLPRQGELRHNRRSFGEARYEFFPERDAFDKVIREGMFGDYSNAFLILTGKTTDERKCIYTKYSDERSRMFAVRTDVLEAKCERYVRKQALYPEGVGHLNHIEHCYRQLTRRYQDSGLKINRCEREEDNLYLEYLEGRSLSDAIKIRLEEKDADGVQRLIDKYCQYVSYGCKCSKFEASPEFHAVFGEVELPENLIGATGLDIDMIFPNIIINEQGWNLLDYEWTFDFPIPIHFVIYRAFFYEILEQPEYAYLQLQEMLGKMGIGEAEAAMYQNMEKAFQSYAMQGMVPTRDMQELIGNPIVSVLDMEQEREQLRREHGEMSSALHHTQLELAAIKNTRTWKIRTRLRGEK